MELSEYITLGAMLVALVVAVIAFRRSGEPLTLQGVQEIAGNAQSLAVELSQVAEVAVASAQQLKESGKLDNNGAFEHAVDHVERWYNSVAPDVQLDPQVVANAVESAYYWIRRTQTADAQPTPFDALPAEYRQPTDRQGGQTSKPDADLVDRFLLGGTGAASASGLSPSPGAR